ncbi:MAG: hypothetical protein FWC92_07125 [Defluviitaleaceae bacterium]|nr:hypothetical protein [Defluviitaleaceae bacterium]
MIQQLAVYDESGTQIGMTFPKRARQLISKQRALWHDDTHTAIRLLPDTKVDTPLEEYLGDALDDTPGPSASNDLLLYLAKKNVREKRNLIKHILAYIAAWPVISVFYHLIIHGARHPAYWQMRRAIQALDQLNVAANPRSRVEDAIMSLYNGLMHPMMYLIFGFMVAWGIFIIARIVNRVIASYRVGRVKKAKRDPVQIEFQRLKDMSTMMG